MTKQLNSNSKPQDILSRLRNIPCAVVCDAMHVLKMPSSTFDSSVKHMAGPSFIGYARTVDRFSDAMNARQHNFDDELFLGTQLVIDDLEKDSVLVVGVGGDTSGAIWGANMATRARAMGAVALVTDGSVRDIGQMDGIGISVFAQGNSPRVNFTQIVTRSINLPVVCAGVLVRPGDIVKGDRDGVVVIPFEDAEKVATKAIEIEVVENEMIEFIANGNSLVSAIKKYKQR